MAIPICFSIVFFILMVYTFSQQLEFELADIEKVVGLVIQFALNESFIPWTVFSCENII